MITVWRLVINGLRLRFFEQAIRAGPDAEDGSGFWVKATPVIRYDCAADKRECLREFLSYPAIMDRHVPALQSALPQSSLIIAHTLAE